MPTADFVIEGCVDPTEPLREEGPFGDHPGFAPAARAFLAAVADNGIPVAIRLL